jgi:hypothetical protein
MIFEAYHGVDGAQHQANFNRLSGQGYRTKDLEIGLVGATMAYTPVPWSLEGILRITTDSAYRLIRARARNGTGSG